MATPRPRRRSPGQAILLLLGATLLGSTLLSAQASPPSPEDLFKQGNEFSRLEKWKKATEAYRKAIDARPGYVEAHYNLARAYTNEQRFADAIREYREVLGLKPDFPGVHRLLGGLYEAQG